MLSQALMQRTTCGRARKKICWCTPSCGKLLTARTRKQHYRALTRAEFQYKDDSESTADSILVTGTVNQAGAIPERHPEPDDNDLVFSGPDSSSESEMESIASDGKYRIIQFNHGYLTMLRSRRFLRH